MHKILIIDDEPALRQTLGAILKRANYTPVLASTGHEGIEKLKSEQFELVFLDIKLPDVMGVDLLPIIREIDAALPVIILTAHATLEAAMQAVRGGARDFMLKPIDPPNILERVENLLFDAQQPKRQREVLTQLQDLLAELISPESASPYALQAAQSTETDPGDERYLLCGGLKADLYTRHLMVSNRVVSLPPSSFDYLVTLMRHSPEAVSYEDLVRETQGFACSKLEARDMSRWHIHKIRKVLEQDSSNPQYLVTIRDFGYRLIG